MPNTCSVPSCQNNGKSVAKVATARGVVFYRIPKNPAQREAWLRALNENAPHRNFTGEHVRICSEHFPNGRNSQDVVPTRFVAHDALATGLAELPVLNNVAAEVPVAEVEQHVQVIQDPHALHIDDADAAHVMSPVAAAMATGEGSVSTGATASQSTGHVATSKSSGERGSVAATGNSRRATVGVRQSSSAGKDSGMASSANSLTSQDEDTEENSQKPANVQKTGEVFKDFVSSAASVPGGWSYNSNNQGTSSTRQGVTSSSRGQGFTSNNTAIVHDSLVGTSSGPARDAATCPIATSSVARNAAPTPVPTASIPAATRPALTSAAASSADGASAPSLANIPYHSIGAGPLKQGQGQSDYTPSLDIDSETAAQVLSDVSSITSMHPVNEIGHSSSSRTQRQSQTAGCASSGTCQEQARLPTLSGCLGSESLLGIARTSELQWAQPRFVSPLPSQRSLPANPIPLHADVWPLPVYNTEQFGLPTKQEMPFEGEGNQRQDSMQASFGSVAPHIACSTVDPPAANRVGDVTATEPHWKGHFSAVHQPSSFSGKLDAANGFVGQEFHRSLAAMDEVCEVHTATGLCNAGQSVLQPASTGDVDWQAIVRPDNLRRWIGRAEERH
eukprot:scpid42992/ scgid16367/ 